jgi:hypothetical protein
MGRYIVTDLTRFNDPKIVCVAVIDTDNWQCLRPLPYFTSDFVKDEDIHPGAILEGPLTLKPDVVKPHIEDASKSSDLKKNGQASSAEFKSILENTKFDSVSSGFGVEFEVGQKHIPVEQQQLAVRSIITIRVLPSQLCIREKLDNWGSFRLTLTDESGHEFQSLKIQDLGFVDYAQKHKNDGKLADLREFLSSQEKIYLRIGVGRPPHEIRGKNGYWLQVNGIYSFPKFLKEIRSY